MGRKIKIQEIILLVISTLATITIALAIIRWKAPTLLGIPTDMVLVKSSKEAVPFYENIFNPAHVNPGKIILEDPFVRVRNKQLIPNMGGIGPNDILGFRNISVPNEADIIVIGDSQTYGNNALIWENWPHLLKFYIPANVTIYSMATGGWGALQYVYAFAKSINFKPKLAIIAFYTGNDPIDTYSFAQASNLWQEFIPEGVNLDDYKLPIVDYPAPPDQQWTVEFPDGTGTVFTPTLRNTSNQKVKSIDIAYEIMINVSRKIKELAERKNIKVFYTIIPTKEYVYSGKIIHDGIKMDAAYKSLIENESYRIDAFSRELNKISPGSYIDVADRLMQEALKPVKLYPANINGHPLPAGYGVIADEIGKRIAGVLDSKQSDGVYFSKTLGDQRFPVYVRNKMFWIVIGDTGVLLRKTGMKEFPELEIRELTHLIFGGYVEMKTIIEQNQIHNNP